MSAHAALVLVLATTSKTPFYIAGGLLAVWAVVVSALGISRPDFPGSGGARAVTMGISVVLVVAAMATAVLTATFEHTETAKAAKKPAAAPAPAPSSGGSTTTGGATSGGGAAGGTVDIAADPAGSLRYVQKTATASAGKVTIDFTNKSPVPHNVTIVQGSGSPLGATKTISNGTAQASVTLKPGSYTFFCSVDGHRAAGMQGTLVVK
jgi:plastocyanin